MKDILIYIRDLSGHTPAAEFGVKLAADLAAGVTGLYVLPAPVYAASPLEPGLDVEVQETTRDQEQAAVNARQSFLDWSTSLGASKARWIVAEGNAGHAVAQATLWHDLLVVDDTSLEKSLAWDIPNLLLHSDVPCIVIPNRKVHYEPIHRVAIGWNGSPEAMRAIHAALPLMQGKEVLLLSGQVRGTHPGVTWITPFEIVEYLQRHGIVVEPRAITSASHKAGAALLEEAARFGANLLVVGAYGRNRYSEWLLGGVTGDVLAQAEMPLLLRH